MQPLDSLALRVRDGRLWILDQTRLPGERVWVDGSDPAEMVGHIRALRVRGAPLLGVAAALSAACAAEGGAGERRLREALAALRAARPTAVNLMGAVDRLAAVLDLGGGVQDVVAEAERIFLEDVRLCERLGDLGAALIAPGEAVLTHCNAGALATAGIGTALGVVRRAHAQGRLAHVFVDETRPLLQGARLTAWELDQAGIPFTLITDAMAAPLMAQGRIHRVLVGADRIAANGDVANKIGTYGVAVSAWHHGIPFHPVAPWTTVDLGCPDGASIPIEARDPEEVRGFAGQRWTRPGCPAANPAFDVTPAALVTSLVLDVGVLTGPDLADGALGRISPGGSGPRGA